MVLSVCLCHYIWPKDGLILRTVALTRWCRGLRHVVGFAGQCLLPELTDHVIYHIMLAPSS